MAPLALKIKGNKSFSPLANLDSEEDLSKTWRVCTKVKDSLENGSRLENLSWRLWFRQHLLSLKSNDPFKKVSNNTTRQLDHQSSKLMPFNHNERPTSDTTNKLDDKNKQENDTVVTVEEREGSPVIEVKADTAPVPTAGVMTIPTAQFQQQESPWSADAQNTPYSEDTLMGTNALQQQQQQPLQGTSMASSAAIQIPVLGEYDQPNTHTETNAEDINNGFGQQTFVLHQFTSDQASDQMIELDDIFGSLGSLSDLLPADTNNSTTAIMSPGIVNNGTGNGIEFSTQWDFNEVGTPINSYFPTSPVYQQYQQAQPQPQMYPTQLHRQRPPSPMLFDRESLVNRMTSFPKQQLQPNISYSVPSSPLLGPGSYHQHFQKPPINNRGVIHQNTLDYFGVNNGETSLRMPPPSTQVLQNKIANIPQTAGEYAAHLYHTQSKDIISPSLCASASTSLSSVTSPSGSSPNMVDQTNYGNVLQEENRVLSYALPNRQATDGTQDQQLRLMRTTTPSTSTASSPATTPTGIGAPISEPFSRPKKTTASVTTSDSNGGNPICSNCGATSTPLWRRSPDDELLCNACGLYQKLHNAPRPKTLKPNNGRKDLGEEEGEQLVCSNCFTTTTPLWRRDEEGSPLCNACGLYLKLHHEQRPLSMKTDIIKKRQRYEGGNSSNPNNSNNGNGSKGGTRKPANKIPKTEHSPSLEPSLATVQQSRQPVFLNNSHNSMTRSDLVAITQQQQQQHLAFMYVNQQQRQQQQQIHSPVDEILQPQFL